MIEKILIKKAHYYLKNGRANEALVLCNNVISRGHISGLIFLIRGRSLVIKNKLEEAKKQYKQLLKFYPDEFNGWLELGNVKRRLKELEKAVICYEKAINIRPDDERGYLAIIRTFEENKDFSKAALYLHKAFSKMKNKPNSIVKISHNIGQKRLEIGEYDRALEILRYALEIAKSSEEITEDVTSEILIEYTSAFMKLKDL